MSRPQRERLVGYYTPTRLHPKIVVLPQCEAFSACFAGRHSIPDLHDTKLTEGERLVRTFVALHGRFLCSNLGRRTISKANMATSRLKPCYGLSWLCLFVECVARTKL